MNYSGKIVLYAAIAAAGLLSALTLTSGSAQGEASYRLLDPVPELVVSDTLELLTLNLAHARGTAVNQMLVSTATHKKNLDDVAALIMESGAEVVALQEADAASLWSGAFDHVAFLADGAQYGSYVHGHHADSWPYTYGAALMSRYKLSAARSHRFDPSWPTAGKGFVRGSIMWSPAGDGQSAREVTLVSVHLDFSRQAVRKAQIAELIADLKGLTTPLVIMGDFNADWSSENSPVRVLARELGLRAFKPTAQELGTYKSVKRLDWILISAELDFLEYTVLPKIVSDHLAVVASIAWKAGN